MQNKTLNKIILELKKLTAGSRKQEASSMIVKHCTRGFTIIEVMIAMGIFTVLLTIGMTATLDAINQHKQSENIRSAMDSINYVLEDMSRNIRLGSNLHCGGDPIFSTGVIIPLDCSYDPSLPHNKLVFNDLNNNVVTYVFTPDTTTTPTTAIIRKQVGTAPDQIIMPPEVKIDYAASGFTVRGALPFVNAGFGRDDGQPTVTIRLAGDVIYKKLHSKFSVQNTVTLRALDN